MNVTALTGSQVKNIGLVQQTKIPTKNNVEKSKNISFVIQPYKGNPPDTSNVPETVKMEQSNTTNQRNAVKKVVTIGTENVDETT